MKFVTEDLMIAVTCNTINIKKSNLGKCYSFMLIYLFIDMYI